MRYSKIRLAAILAIATGATAPLVAVDGYKNTPIIPGTQWHVHDPDRPQPEKVSGTCLQTPAPSDAEILFDGKNLDAWEPVTRKKDKKTFNTLWPVRDGVTVVTDNDIRTKKSYGDCQLHLEWRVPADRKVRGQQGANSGVFFMNTLYEIQILENFKNRSYADGSAGAIYGQFPPLVNPANPQGEWQSYDICFTAPRFDKDGQPLSPTKATVVFNGVVVQSNREFLGPTKWRDVGKYKAHAARLPLQLQFHGDPIEFRNIWIRDLEKPADAPAK